MQFYPSSGYFILGPSILFRTLFSNTLNMFSNFRARDQA
jgi:hypothetical protein